MKLKKINSSPINLREKATIFNVRASCIWIIHSNVSWSILKNTCNTNRGIGNIPEGFIFSRGQTLPCRDKVDDSKEKNQWILSR